MCAELCEGLLKGLIKYWAKRDRFVLRQTTYLGPIQLHLRVGFTNPSLMENSEVRHVDEIQILNMPNETMIHD